MRRSGAGGVYLCVSDALHGTRGREREEENERIKPLGPSARRFNSKEKLASEAICAVPRRIAHR